MGKSRRAYKSWGKKQLTSCPAISCNKAGKSTVTFIYSLSQWVKFNLTNDFRYDLPEGAWSDSPLLRRFQELARFSARCKCTETPWDQFVGDCWGWWSLWHQSSTLPLIFSMERIEMLRPSGSRCLFQILVTRREKQSHGSLQAEPFPSFSSALWGCTSPDPSWRWGAEPCLGEEEVSPIFLVGTSILFVPPGEDKTASSWCRKVR